MSKNLTTSGNYNINTGTDDVNITAANVAVTGNLIVTGTTTTITTTNLAITDNVIVLNKDEAGAGLTAGTDGELITWDASGNPATVAVGTSSHILTSGGTSLLFRSSRPYFFTFSLFHFFHF